MGTPPAHPPPIYVWKWWDGAVSATGTYSGSVQKKLNLGGNPEETFTVPYRCEVCDSLGNVIQVIPGALEVNNPPIVVPSPVVTPQDQPFPYTAQAQVRAYDLENTEVKFYWYRGTHPYGGHATTVQDFTVEGTYYGTVISGGPLNGYTNTCSITALGAGTVMTCKVVDTDGGTTTVNFLLRGYDPASPRFAAAALPSTLTMAAARLPTQVIAPGQSVVFTCYGYDTAPGPLRYTWQFYGSNGWTRPGLPLLYADNGTAAGVGSKSEYTLGIEGESAGQKFAVVSVGNLATGRMAYTTLPVQLVKNEAPSITEIGMYDAVSQQAVTTITKQALPARTVIQYNGTASEANLDVMAWKWDIIPPVGPAYSVYGRTAFLDVSDWPDALYNAYGVVTAYDRYGQGSVPVTLPQVTLTS